MKIGFNLGQIFTYIDSKYGKQKNIPIDLYNKIIKETSNEWLENIRFSGTLSNYMNVHELGYGEYPETFQQWNLLANRLPKSDQNKITSEIAKTALKKTLGFFGKAIKANTEEQNMKLLVDYTKQYVGSSYIVNFVETIKQLKSKNNSFTFNSHMPFRKLHTLEQSLSSLKYVKDRITISNIELENEGYDNAYIWEKHRDEYFKYLYDVIAPAITKIMGKNIPLGIPIAPHDEWYRYAEWNRKALELANKLKQEGYNPYIVAHIYPSINSNEELEKYVQFAANTAKGFDVRITEFNLSSDAKVKFSQEDTINFIKNFAKICSYYDNIVEIDYHSLWTQDGAHYSFIK